MATLVTNSVTHSCLVDLIDVTLACEDADSKLVEVDDVDDENRVGNSCCRFGSEDFKFKFSRDADVWLRF